MKKMIAAFMLIMAFVTPAYADSMSCFETPANDAIFNDRTGYNKQQQREVAYGQLENPVMELMMCAVSNLQGGISLDILKSNCKCKERVKEICHFSIKKGKIRYKPQQGAELAWCMVFPLNMWTKK